MRRIPFETYAKIHVKKADPLFLPPDPLWIPSGSPVAAWQIPLHFGCLRYSLYQETLSRAYNVTRARCVLCMCLWFVF